MGTSPPPCAQAREEASRQLTIAKINSPARPWASADNGLGLYGRNGQPEVKKSGTMREGVAIL